MQASLTESAVDAATVPCFQTRYLDIDAIRQLLQRHGVSTVLQQLVEYIDADFRRWPEFQKCARVANHSATGVIELMPVADHERYGFKYVNGHPGNTRHDMPTVMAFGALADVATGFPLLLSEFTMVTALRTAATSVWAARLLARPDATCMAVIGNGAQSEFQILAFHAVLGVHTFRLYDIDPDATAKLQRNLSGVPGLKLMACTDTASAVAGADIVTTITADKHYATIITSDMLTPGMHLNAVGGDCPGKTELHADVLHQSSVFVEFEPQTRIEGDIQQLPSDFPVTELWQVATGQHPGRRRADEITVFDSVGFALEDYSALRYLDAQATTDHLGSVIKLIPQQFNPKDLFGFACR